MNLTPTNKLYELCLKYDLKSGELSAKQIIDKYSKFAAAAANNNGSIELQELISFVMYYVLYNHQNPLPILIELQSSSQSTF